jgi:chromosome segregation ATPase
VLLCASAVSLRVEANPIRKIVTLLQDMQVEIEAEGKKEQALFDKFMCYCDGNTDGMSNAAKDASQRIEELKSKLEAEKAEKSQLDQELIQHKQDRESAQQDLAKAEQIRNKEHAQFAADSGDAKANLDALNGAIAALAKGMGSFVQMSAPSKQRLVSLAQGIEDSDERETMLALLQGKQNMFGDYSSQSDSILGMMKSMKDEMDKDLAEMISDEEAAAAGFVQLQDAKKQAITASSSAIESKTQRSGELAVQVVTTQDDLEDTTADLADTEAFLANLAASCKTKKDEWAQRSKVRADEVASISEAIKILNDDDALDVFKKTLSMAQTAGQSFLQKASKASVAKRASVLLAHLPREPQLALLQFALKAKKVDFSKVLGMVDAMVTQLGKEQQDDDSQKQYCESSISENEANKAEVEEQIEASAAQMSDMKEQSAQLEQEIATLGKEVQDLDKAVADATAQRKAEHEDYVAASAANNAALGLIEKAKNRLFKFYRPNLHKEEPQAEAQPVFVQMAKQPEPAPETWDGEYKGKQGKSNGVIALMDEMIDELKTDMTDAKHEEETGQKDYERLMAESQASREKKANSSTAKSSAKADLDVKLEDTATAKTAQEQDLANVKETLAQLHSSCDFLIENFDLRKSARANEIDSLKNAKAVLSGADFA